MKINRNIVAIMAVAGLGYAAGQLDLLPGGTSIAAPGDHEGDHEAHQHDMSPEMLAMMDAGTPGEHHKMLQPLVGEFEGEWTIWMDPEGAPFVSRGTVTREWVLGGRFVKETVEAESEGNHFSGIGYIGYNNVDGQFETVWMDSMSTGIYKETSTVDPDTMTMTTRSSMRDPHSGKIINSRGTMELTSGRQKYVSYITGPDGKEYKHMVGVTERR